MAVEVQPVPGSKVYPRWVGPSLIIGLALVLVVLWYRQRPDGIGDVRFAGELIGVEIVTLLCWALVLMTLLPLVERVFGGLDRMTVWHRRVAVVAVILIPVHLILISTQEDPDASTIGNALGYIALFGLVILILWAILPTLIRLRLKVPHRLRDVAQRGFHQWMSWHRFIGLFVIAAMLHGIFVDQVLREASSLRWIFVAICAVGVAAYGYRELWLQPRLRNFSYTVSETRHLDSSVAEVTLAPAAEAVTFTPGQFLFIGFNGFDEGRKHPFTISSGAGEPHLRLSIANAGDFTRDVYQQMTPGVTAKIVGPFGQFDYTDGGANQIWAAGGIGVTPFISWIRSFPAKLTRSIDFFYSVRTRADAIFLDEMQAAAAAHDSFTLHLHCSDTDGFLTATEITAVVKDPGTTWAYMCGPLPMVTAFKDGLHAQGVPNRNIIWEHFTSIR